jgi:hypothetical protein
MTAWVRARRVWMEPLLGGKCHLECGRFRRKEMLWTILGILLVLWLLGFIGSVGGSLVHILLVVAVVVLALQLFSGRRALG